MKLIEDKILYSVLLRRLFGRTAYFVSNRPAAGAAALIASMALAGCSTLAPLDSYPARVQPPADALLVLSPGAGAILSVVETGYVNALEQVISLDTNARSPGQNYISIQQFATKAESSTPGGLQDVPLANLDMAGEARGTVSYADMKLSPYFVQNAYGPFGYSMGRTATSDTCMYAWQRIAPDMMPGGGVARGAINMRALICDRSKSEQELLQIMLQLRIKGVTGQATKAPAVIGAYGIVVQPFGPAGVGNVLPPVVPAAPPPVATPSPAPSTPAPVIPDDPPGPVTPPAEPGTGVPQPGGDVPVVPLPAVVAPTPSTPPSIAASS